MIRPAPIDTIRERHRVTQDGRRDPRSIGLAMPKGFRDKKGCGLSSGEVLPGAPPARGATCTHRPPAFLRGAATTGIVAAGRDQPGRGHRCLELAGGQ